MSDDERSSLDVAADEAAEIMAMRGNASWSALVATLEEQAETARRRFLLAQRLQAAFVADGGQLPLFPDAAVKTKKPRAKRRVMMHESNGAFQCAKCHGVTGIPVDMTESARKHGIPCPECNRSVSE